MASGKFCALKINLAIGFIRKTHWDTVHWLGCNDAVPWLNEAKLEYFGLQFEYLEINLYFICLPACLP